MNYKYCDENDIFKGIVGKEILWVVSDKVSKASLRFVKVLRFPTKGTRLYELAFRDGNTMEVTPEHLDRAFVRDERIRHGKEVVTNFTDPAAMEVLYTLSHSHELLNKRKSTTPQQNQYGMEVEHTVVISLRRHLKTGT